MEEERYPVGKGARRALIALILAHVVLASWFAIATPYRQAGTIKFQRGAPAVDIGAPDERQHANYVQHILDGKGLPVFDPKDPNLGESYQSHQPPLYYVLATGFAKATGVASVESGRTLRFLNVIIGGFTVAGVFFACYWGFGRARWAVAAAAFAALLPMNLALSGAISNDPLLFCLITWASAVLFLALRDGWSLKLTVLLGLFAGAAVLTKTSGVALLPALLVGAFWDRERRPCWGRTLTASAVIALLCVPWWARNQMLYGDPLAMNAFNQAFVGSPQALDFMKAVGPGAYWMDYVGWWTGRSLLGVFGYMDVFLPDNVYRIWLVVFAFMLGFGIATVKSKPGERSAPLAAMTTLLVVVVVLFFRFNSQYFQGQARYLLPALVSIAILATGWARRVELSRTWVGAMAAALLAIDLWVLLTLPGEFTQRM